MQVVRKIRSFRPASGYIFVVPPRHGFCAVVSTGAVRCACVNLDEARCWHDTQ